MPFLVETGAGVGSANSYVSVAYADAYFSDRGRTDWTGSDSVKEKALVRATDYLDQRFAHRWKGGKASADNPLSWPRKGVTLSDGSPVEDDVVPAPILKAVSEYARLALTRTELAPIAAEVGSDQTGRVRRRSTSETIGPISTQTDEEYEDLSMRQVNAAQFGRGDTSLVLNQASLPEYPMADLWLEELLRNIDTTPAQQGVGVSVSGAGDDLQFEEDWESRFENKGGRYPGSVRNWW